MMKIIFYFVLLGALFLTVTQAEDLLFEKVHLVDYDSTSGNFIFRGNLPVLNQTFALDTLASYMKKRAEENNVAFPEKFIIHDISLIWEIEEPFIDYKYEVAFWDDEKNQKYGSLTKWPISFSGLVVTPDMMPESWARSIAKKFVKIDGLIDKVQTVREILVTKEEVPQIVYIHCHYGCDRTGELVGSYRMYYHNIKVEEMYKRNLEECGRTENYPATESLKWFCLMLEDERSQDYGDCVGFATCLVPWGYCKINV